MTLLAAALIKGTVTFPKALHVMDAIVENSDCSVIFTHYESVSFKFSLKTNE